MTTRLYTEVGSGWVDVPEGGHLIEGLPADLDEHLSHLLAASGGPVEVGFNTWALCQPTAQFYSPGDIGWLVHHRIMLPQWAKEVVRGQITLSLARRETVALFDLINTI